MRVVFGFLGLIFGALLGAYGLILVLYQGEERSEGDTYVSIGGNRIDADVLGVPLLVVALVVIAVSLRALRRSGVP